MDGTMGERDVRGEVGELCGSGRSRAVRGNYDNIWAFLAVGYDRRLWDLLMRDTK
jgi:hypothetical protein